MPKGRSEDHKIPDGVGGQKRFSKTRTKGKRGSSNGPAGPRYISHNRGKSHARNQVGILSAAGKGRGGEKIGKGEQRQKRRGRVQKKRLNR